MKCTTVITSFNRRHCIEQAIDSALRELPDCEVVVIDDASTDGTPQFIRDHYSSEIQKGSLSLHCLPSNIGVSGAKNIGYECAQGDWVIFLDSDDFYEMGAGVLIVEEIYRSTDCPIVFFRCRTHAGEFVGKHEGKSLLLDLDAYLRHTSFGEALTAINKTLTGGSPPYVQSLRGYEGIGCARRICEFGPARLSSAVARIYVTQGDDRLSVSKGFLLRMPLLARGHLLMLREFVRYMSIQQILALLLKAVVYWVFGNSYRVLSKK